MSDSLANPIGRIKLIWPKMKKRREARPLQQKRTSGNRRPQRRGPAAAPVITKETAPKYEQLYTGNGRGSKPVKKTLGPSFDCAGFILLVRQTYNRLCIEDQRLPRSMPYAIFQHAMVEFFNYIKRNLCWNPVLLSLMDPLTAISAEDYNIPQPIYEYICDFCSTITPTGDKVSWNLPSIVT